MHNLLFEFVADSASHQPLARAIIARSSTTNGNKNNGSETTEYKCKYKKTRGI
jgi:hypothetical protein